MRFSSLSHPTCRSSAPLCPSCPLLFSLLRGRCWKYLPVQELQDFQAMSLYHHRLKVKCRKPRSLQTALLPRPCTVSRSLLPDLRKRRQAHLLKALSPPVPVQGFHLYCCHFPAPSSPQAGQTWLFLHRSAGMSTVAEGMRKELSPLPRHRRGRIPYIRISSALLFSL